MVKKLLTIKIIGICFMTYFAVRSILRWNQNNHVIPHPRRASFSSQNQLKAEGNPHAAYLLWDHMGRFGNNMFEYASSYCIAKQSHLIPTITESSRLLKVFKNITAEGISVEFQRQIRTDTEDRHEKGYAVYSPDIAQIEHTSSPIHLSGYLQSYKYFSKCYDDIEQQFTLNDDLQDEVRQTMVRVVLDHLLAKNYISARNKDLFLKNQTIPQEITYIGIHARVNLSYTSGEDYFSNGMAYLRKKYQKVMFLMCTDNSAQVKMSLQNIIHHQDVVLMSDHTSNYEIDFGILVNCNHSIITGGTYSWWSGWLAGGEVVYPKGYAQYHSQHEASVYVWQDYYPDHWIPM